MKVSKTETYCFSFDEKDARLIDRIVRYRVGNMTVDNILNSFTTTGAFYVGVFGALKKIRDIGCSCRLTAQENTSIRMLLYQAAGSDDFKDDKENINALYNALMTVYKVEG